jgi:glycosyltransferase involved in cell wall biosynthesis
MPNVRVCVCIATCRRPEGLRRLLEGLARQEFRGDAPLLSFVVVDNDPTSSSAVRTVVDEIAAELPGAVVLVEEARRGIPHARNAGLDRAGDADWVAFVDDDEVPSIGWLYELMAVQERTGADVVTGPVIPRFEAPPPRWAIAGAFFERERYETGTELGVAYTHNVLLRGTLAASRFDGSFALSGGSDSEYFRRLHRGGARIVWADDAVVTEWIPESRVTVSWVIRRAYRVGNGIARIALDASPGIRTVGFTLGNALLRLLRGGAGLALFAFGPAHRRVEALDTIAAGVGRLTGLRGRSAREYETIHGS